MPCYYTGSAEGDRALAAEEGKERLVKKITNLTQMLCDCCQFIEASGYDMPYKGIENFWKKHKKIDAKRKKK